jgi:hypothetical protein
MLAVAALLALAATGAGAQPKKPAAKATAAPPPAQIMAMRIPGSGPIEDPLARHWNDARPYTVAMLPQTVTRPHKPDPAVKALVVRAAHNGGWIAVLAEWKDESLSDRIVLDNFGDQVAIQLPIDPKTTPSPMMGNHGGRVNIMQWRAALQHDIEHGPPSLHSLYPFAWTDVYPDEVLGAADARPYSGAVGLENPISRGRATPVLDQMAEGWGTMTVKPDQHALGRGVWKDGTWRVVITRPMVSDDVNAPRLTPGDRTVIAFAVWEGGNREVGARKAWSAWTPLWVAR